MKNYPNCHDCGVKPGEFHIEGCDTERCPFCFGQLISCNCIESYFEIDESNMEEKYPEFYHHGFTPVMNDIWDKALKKKGLIAYHTGLEKELDDLFDQGININEAYKKQLYKGSPAKYEYTNGI